VSGTVITNIEARKRTALRDDDDNGHHHDD